MARWKNDPQNREIIKEVTHEMELPIYKPSAKGTFIPWLKESWNKIEDEFVNLKNIANSKEPKFTKNSGFNLNKSDNFNLNNTDILLTTQGSKTLYDELVAKIEALNICPYNVGDWYITCNTQNPAVIWPGTTWERMDGAFLRGISAGENLGSQYGNNTVSLSVSNLPSHAHSGTTTTNGHHNHTQDAHNHTQPAHTHGIKIDHYGNQRLAGVSNNSGDRFGIPNNIITAAGGENTGGARPNIHANGNHNHTFSTNSIGGNKPFSILPRYYAVYMWIRRS